MKKNIYCVKQEYISGGKNVPVPGSHEWFSTYTKAKKAYKEQIQNLYAAELCLKTKAEPNLRFCPYDGTVELAATQIQPMISGKKDIRLILAAVDLQ